MTETPAVPYRVCMPQLLQEKSNLYCIGVMLFTLIPDSSLLSILVSLFFILLCPSFLVLHHYQDFLSLLFPLLYLHLRQAAHSHDCNQLIYTTLIAISSSTR